MLTDTLKQHTKDAHLSVERLIVQKIRSVQNPHDYAELLFLFYGYFDALEKKIDQVINKDRLPDHGDRRKASSLLQDILAIQDQSPADSATDLPSITNHDEALGALYVIEGSTLGGKIIAGMIRKQLNGSSPDAFRFFDGYGTETESKWNTFKDALNDQTLSENNKSLTLSAALETFEKFKQWIERYDSNKKL